MHNIVSSLQGTGVDTLASATGSREGVATNSCLKKKARCMASISCSHVGCRGARPDDTHTHKGSRVNETVTDGVLTHVYHRH